MALRCLNFVDAVRALPPVIIFLRFFSILLNLFVNVLLELNSLAVLICVQKYSKKSNLQMKVPYTETENSYS